MRVIAGTARGVRLRVPRGLKVRPTSARVRTSLFSILGERPQGARVLDLFAGSGALGVEALSRGAAFCCFVENLPAAIAALSRNLESTALGDRALVLRADAFRALPRLKAHGPFDLVFLDPPYRYLKDSDRLAALLAELGDPGYLNRGALVIVQHDRRAAPPPQVGLLRRTDIRNYGNTAITFLAVEPRV